MTIQAVILCGGRGTRLSALYSDRPKILVPVAGRPFIEWQLEWLGRQGIADIHLAAGYRAEVLREWVEIRSQVSGVRCQVSEVRGQASEGSQQADAAMNCACTSSPRAASIGSFACSEVTLQHSAFVFRVSLSAEPSPLGTGGGLKYVEPWLRSDPFLAINGDSLVPQLDLQGLLDTHRQSGRLVTIAATRIERTGRYGTVDFDRTGCITAFREKAERENGWVNAGVYAVTPATLHEIKPGCAVSIETELFPLLASHGLIGVAPCRPPLLDMGTPEGIAAMELYLRDRR
jgi:NDP-sugar pyrophosphorylase family protein